MQGLDEVAGELYALPPDDFRTARDERAAQARAAGDKALAREITALRRPVVSAWLVNMLAREAPGQMGELLSLGESLRDAQQALDGDRLRELSTQRRELVAAMVNEAKRFAARDGRPVSLQVEREVEATLQAALADPEAAAEVSSGRLASPLTYAGLGGGEATPLRPVRPARREGAAPTKEPAVRPVPGDGAARAAASARAAQEAVRRRAEQLARELTEALAEQGRATRAVREAQRGRETAARALDAATKRLARARQAASRLSGSPDDTPADN